MMTIKARRFFHFSFSQHMVLARMVLIVRQLFWLGRRQRVVCAMVVTLLKGGVVH
jgi:hypothetical protein